MSADAALAAQFEADHRHLRGVAYRLTGSWPDAEDALQRAWLAASQANLDDVGNLTGWLTTVTARECLSILRSRQRRREVPLPDAAALESPGPAPAADEAAILAEEVGLALLVVLDRLSPAQRVAFVLHDLFRVPFEDIAEVLRRSPAAAKKLASRARERVHGHPPPARPLTAENLRLAEAFLAAARGGDIGALLGLLAPDVVRRVEPGLVPATVPAELLGARAVAEETRLFAARAQAGGVALIDGAPGIVIAPRGRLQIILRLTIRAGRISEIDIRGRAESLAEANIGLPRRRQDRGMSGLDWDHNSYYHRLLLRHLPGRCERVLDVGCGAGALAARLAGRAGHVDALDRSPVMIEAARRAVPANVTCILGDVLREPLPAARYDAIVSDTALHHMPLDEVLPRLAVALRPGGVLAAVVLPRLDLPREAAAELAGAVGHRALGAAFAVLRAAGRGTWYERPAGHAVMPMVLDPPLTTREARAVAAAALPGARVRRLAYWRYLLVWQRGEGR